MSGTDDQIKDISEAFKPYVPILQEAIEELPTSGKTPDAEIA